MTKQEYYDKYEDHIKIDLDAKHKLEYLVNEVIVLLQNAGISAHANTEPMSDVDTLTFRFPANGVFDGFGLTLSSYGSCYISVAMEPEPGTEAEEEYIMNEEGRTRTP